MRLHGLNAGNVGEIGQRARELLHTLTHNLRQPEARLFCESMPSIEVDAARLPFVRELIARRASTFLSALGQEFSAEERAARRKLKRRVRVGLTAFQTERSPPP